jgi:hypothetical protein
MTVLRAAFAAGLLTLVLAAPAGASSSWPTWGSNWNVRTAPASSAASVGKIDAGAVRGQRVTVDCQVRGELVDLGGGTRSATWAHLVAPLRGFLTVVAIDVPQDVLPGVPTCGGAPAAPAPLPAPAPAPRSVTVLAGAWMTSTPYLTAHVRQGLRPGTYAAVCEARADVAGTYRNPWWTKLANGRWVNNSYLRGGVKMGLGDCAAPRNDGVARPAACAQPYVLLGLRGSGEAPGLGATVGAIVRAALDRLPASRTRTVAIPYAATAVGVIAQGDLGSFMDSMAGGQDLLGAELRRTVARCRNARIAVVGYSQGAGAASEALRALPADVRGHVCAAVIVADPYSRAGGGDDVTFDPLQPDRPGRRAAQGILGGRRAALPPSRYFDVCQTNDIVCDARPRWAGKILNGVLAEIHTTYKSCCSGVPLTRVLGRGAARLLQR